MKKYLAVLLLTGALSLGNSDAVAQCSICKRTSEQMGEKPAKGLNLGIIYLAMTPFAIVGAIAFTWWRKQKSQNP